MIVAVNHHPREIADDARIIRDDRFEHLARSLADRDGLPGAGVDICREIGNGLLRLVEQRPALFGTDVVAHLRRHRGDADDGFGEHAMQVTEGRRRGVHAAPVPMDARIVRHELMNLDDALAPGGPSRAAPGAHDLSRGEAVRAKIVDELVQVFDAGAILFAVACAQHEGAAARFERIGGVALRGQRLVHLDDAPKIELVGQTLQLREGQLHQSTDFRPRARVVLERALEPLHRLRFGRGWVTHAAKNGRKR